MTATFAAGLSVILAAGCASHTASAVAAAAPSVAPPAADDTAASDQRFDLSGEWATGSGSAEPEAQSFTLRPQCLHHPAAWILEQTGDSVDAIVIPESFDQGVAQKGPLRLPSSARGKVSGLNVTLDEPNAHYRLRYDPETGHLRGTLNGQPFWAVRQEVVQPGGCLPPP